MRSGVGLYISAARAHILLNSLIFMAMEKKISSFKMIFSVFSSE